MESEHTAKTLQIALGSYDRKELRVEKNYLQEQSPALECTCFQNGGRLLEQLRQGRQFDVVILCRIRVPYVWNRAMDSAMWAMPN